MSKEELDLLGKKHSLGRMKKEREHAKTEEGRETKTEEGREKLAVEAGFTSTASRSRASEVEAGSSSCEVEKQKEDLPSSRNGYLEELAEDWWNAKVEGGRESLLLKVDLPVLRVHPIIRT